MWEECLKKLDNVDLLPYIIIITSPLTPLLVKERGGDNPELSGLSGVRLIQNRPKILLFQHLFVLISVAIICIFYFCKGQKLLFIKKIIKSLK